ncbi:MAG: hypothetical protein ACRD0A_17490, partial [Acidimicrobiales bacterium]
CALDPTDTPAGFADLPAEPCVIGAVDTDGDHVVYAASRDEAGNEHLVQVEFSIDQTAPATTITLDPATPNGDNDFYVSPVGVTVAATDANPTEVRWAVDPDEAPGSFDDLPAEQCAIGTVDTDGNHVVYAAALDAAGNASLVQADFSIDQTAPATTITLDPVIPDGANNAYASPVGVTVTVEDDTATVRCVLDPATAPGGFAELPDTPCDIGTVGTDGSHIVYAASIDLAGNAGPLARASFLLNQPVPIPPDPPVGNLRLTVSDPTPQRGQTTTASATGFPANDPTRIVIYSTPVRLATATADPTGRLTVRVTIPADATIGPHVLAVFGSDDIATATIQVVAAPSGSGASQGSSGSASGSLASTGFPFSTYVAAALAALLAGSTLVANGRWRRVGRRRSRAAGERTVIQVD